MRLALAGVRGSGKSTLFRAFTGVAAPQATGPAGAAPLAVVKVPDPRLERLRDMFRPEKYTPAAVEVLDLPGLPPPGDADRTSVPRLLASAREADGLLLVVRAFEEPSYPYPEPAADPAREAAHLVGELAFADLDSATKRLEKIRSTGRKSGVKEAEEKEAAALERVVAALEEGRAVKDVTLSGEEDRTLRGFRFLTAKPWVLVVSLPEGAAPAGAAEGIPGKFEVRAAIRGRLEAELLDLPPEERGAFRPEGASGRPASEVLLEASFRALAEISFFTVGEDEVRAWTLRRGESAVAAAGRIHSDLARGFIRAEVVASKDLLELGDMAAARKAGRLRIEGRDYVVQDGDVVNVVSGI